MNQGLVYSLARHPHPPPSILGGASQELTHNTSFIMAPVAIVITFNLSLVGSAGASVPQIHGVQ